jgi:Holliday junction resolvasome RuvABC endonuclease subunit
MTTRNHRKNERILAIAPSSRGFGFAVMEGGDTLVDWGVRSVTGDKNIDALKKAEAMIALYKPGVLVLEDASAKRSRRSRRIRDLTKQIIATTARRRINVALLSREQVMQTFFEDGRGTKHSIARILAMRFREELGHRLPPKRKPWNSEDYRMGIFDAVALALAHSLHRRKQVNMRLI